MALSSGTGPFGPRRAGSFNFDPPEAGVLYLDESPSWIRGRCKGRTIVDSRRTKLLYESARLPVWYFLEEDVDMSVLRESGKTEPTELRGEAALFDLDCDGRTFEGAAWTHREPPPGAEALAGLICFRFDALDEWLDEETQVVGHPRDPYHRIDVRDSARHVVVRVGDTVLADTRRPKILFESALPPRFYIPEEDVNTDLLEPGQGQTTCAYKGRASYLSFGDEVNIAWRYPDPLDDAPPIKDLVSFWNERVDIEVDGEPQERPTTQWSPR